MKPSFVEENHCFFGGLYRRISPLLFLYGGPPINTVVGMSLLFYDPNVS